MREATEILPSRGKLGVLRSGLDLAQRAGMDGIQEWLSFYFKSPMTIPRLYPEHGLFIQRMKQEHLKNDSGREPYNLTRRRLLRVAK
jgi:hypothetical protein